MNLPTGLKILLVAFPCDKTGSAWTGELSFFLSYLATFVRGDGDLGNTGVFLVVALRVLVLRAGLAAVDLEAVAVAGM